ncbi:MAG: hypothetical protein AB7F19_07680 [Candidatus Babeliales bacterium]
MANFRKEAIYETQSKPGVSFRDEAIYEKPLQLGLIDTAKDVYKSAEQGLMKVPSNILGFGNDIANLAHTGGTYVGEKLIQKFADPEYKAEYDQPFPYGSQFFEEKINSLTDSKPYQPKTGFGRQAETTANVVGTVLAGPGRTAKTIGDAAMASVGLQQAKEYAPDSPTTQLAAAILTPIIARKGVDLAQTGLEKLRTALRNPNATQIMQEAQAIGVQPTAGMVGGNFVKGTEDLARKGTTSSLAVTPAIERTRGQIEGNVAKLTQGMGAEPDIVRAGESSIASLRRAAQEQRIPVNKLYEKVDEVFPPNKLTATPNTIKTMEDAIAAYGTEREAKRQLGQKFYDDLVALKTEGASPRFLRDIRQENRNIQYNPATPQAEKRAANIMAKSVTDDLKQGAKNISDEALASFEAADAANAAYRARFNPFKGWLENDPEKAKTVESFVNKFVNSTKENKVGDTRFLIRARNALPEKDFDKLTGFVFNKLGEGREGFDPATFFTNYNKMSNSAKKILTRGDQGHLSALEHIAKVSKEFAGNAISKNPSGTAGQAATGLQIAGAATTSGAAILQGKPLTALLSAIATLGLPYAGGKLLESKVFVNWLAKAPKDPKQLTSYIETLNNVAKASPAIANEIMEYKNKLKTEN